MAAGIGIPAAAACAADAAANYPARPIRIVVPFPPGGGVDALARDLAEHMAATWKQTVVIDNRAGANTLIGAQTVASSAPDGYTLLMAIDSTLVMNQYLYAKLPYDPVKDFTPIAMTGKGTLVLAVNAEHGPKSLQELIDRAKAQPGRLNAGTGTVSLQLSEEMFKRAAGIDLVNVPYKGSSPTVQALLANDVDMIFDGIGTSLPFIKSGRLRALAVLGAEPSPLVPGVPTVASAPGMDGYDVSTWFALLAPAGTPPGIVEKIRGETKRILALPEIREKFALRGHEPIFSTSQKFAAFLQSESTKWKATIQESGITLQ
jgi:tripartite-type tricarboxylate transporter receptor subunit TctC